MSKSLILKGIQDHIELISSNKEYLSESILKASELVISCLQNGGKIILFGNGGSAADAQHIAAEFTGRFVKERVGLPALALTTDTSALTAIGNDYGFENIFSRQLEAIAKNGDVLIGISTSGNSPNVVNAINVGKNLGCIAITLTGKDGGELCHICDLNINVNDSTTARVQETHILIGHLICMLVDNLY